MPATNILANLFVTLYNTGARRKRQCTIYPTSSLAIEVLKTLQKDGYIESYEHIEDKRGGKFTIELGAKLQNVEQYHRALEFQMTSILFGRDSIFQHTTVACCLSLQTRV